jgi:predicted DNA-binding transcriptional regulator AlpA
MAQASGSGRAAVVVAHAEPGTRPNKLLRLTVVAERLGCSKKTAWRLYRSGAFPGAGILLGAVKVPEHSLLAYLRRARGVSQ